ncbi:Cytochrome P450 71A1 [Morella rubra]|uniref:Cytochrome P450 71A1 n=1 Tax=Morella rubra TaxID=262757 RepID=A0A6A1VWF0_9ROSI|nr:Cytochrome P450 71A1 [Morella rubra]
MALMPLLQQSWQELQIFPLSLLLLFCSLYVFKRIPNGKQNLPPSPPKLPIIGHLHHLGTLPHRSLHALSKKYGPIMFLYFGHSPTLVVSSADMAKEMLKTHDLVFSNRPKSQLPRSYSTVPETLRSHPMDMFVAGIDTTSTALEWAMAELIKNPNIMKRAQEEVRGAVGNKSKIDVHDINRMDYLKCIINETLRLHPPLPLLLPRETSASVRFGGYDIPAKTRVYINAWAIQRDPAVWERPEEFLPERFKDNPVDFRGHYYEFLPFGGGRRGCPGITFSVASVEYVIANILCWFDWEMPSAGVQGQDLEMREGNGITVPKKIPLHLRPTLHAS